MKQIITVLVFLITTLSYGQTSAGIQRDSSNVLPVQSMKIAFDVHSAEEVEEAFHPEPLREFLKDAVAGETVIFSINCLRPNSNTVLKQNFSFQSSGKTTEVETWMTRLEKIKKIALNFYKNQ